MKKKHALNFWALSSIIAISANAGNPEIEENPYQFDVNSNDFGFNW